MASVVQYFLVVVFVAAALMKIASHDGFLRTLTAIPWLPLRVARVTAHAVPMLELAVGALLLAAPRAGALAALVSLGVFTGVVAGEVALRHDFRCGCFGAAATGSGGRGTLARNAGLLAAAGALLVLPASFEPGAVLLGAGLGFAFLLGEVGLETVRLERGK